MLGLGSHKLRADEFSLNSQVQDFNASVFKIKFFFLLLSPHDIAFYNYFNESVFHVNYFYPPLYPKD